MCWFVHSLNKHLSSIYLSPRNHLCARDANSKDPLSGSLRSSEKDQQWPIGKLCVWGVGGRSARKENEGGEELGEWREGGATSFSVCHLTLGSNSPSSCNFLCSIGYIFQG